VSVTVHKDVMVAMGDGVELATDLWASDRVRAIAPCVTTTDYYTTPWYSDGGALSWHSIQSWSTQMALAEALRQLGRGVGVPQLLAATRALLAHPQPHLEALPPSRQPVLEKV